MEKFKQRLPLIAALVFVLVSSDSQAQTLQRQTNGTSGGMADIAGFHFQFTVGQPYHTLSNYSNSIGTRPGFIQPLLVAGSKAPNPIVFKVYPNPTQDVVHMTSDTELKQPSLIVTNLQGIKVHDVPYVDPRFITIDCSNWTSGTYFITVRDENIAIHTSKIIKIN